VRAEGIAKAKKAGVYTGGKPRIDRHRIRELVSGGSGSAAIARAMGISRMSVYRTMRETT
jgi:DNA invertase Pin-like site-specific DNA recombinase